MQEAKEFFCMDEKAREHMLFGGWRSGKLYRALDVQILPCASRYVAYDGTVSEDDGSCVWDIEETIKYLGSAIQIIINTNQGIFNTNKYDEDRVQKQSVLYSVQTRSDLAWFVGGYINRNELEDEIDLM